LKNNVEWFRILSSDIDLVERKRWIFCKHEWRLQKSGLTAMEKGMLDLCILLLFTLKCSILFFLFPTQSVLWVTIYVCIKEGEEKEEISSTAKDPPWSFSTPPCEINTMHQKMMLVCWLRIYI
jgi:hypothetical protein